MIRFMKHQLKHLKRKFSCSIRPDHAHGGARSARLQLRPDHYAIVFAAFERIEPRTCFAEPKMLHAVCVYGSLSRIHFETKPKKSPSFAERRRAIRICASHEHVLFLRRDCFVRHLSLAIPKPIKPMVISPNSGTETSSPWAGVPFREARPSLFPNPELTRRILR